MQQLCRDGYFCLLQDMVFTLEKGIFVEVAVAAPSAPSPHSLRALKTCTAAKSHLYLPAQASATQAIRASAASVALPKWLISACEYTDERRAVL